MDPDRKKALRRRMYLEQAHLRYLQTLAHYPESIQPEIERRLQCIVEAQEVIALHVKAVRLLKTQRDSADALIVQAKQALEYFGKELNKLAAEEYIAEYLKINKKLKEED